MTVEFNINALNLFKNANLENENDILVLDKKEAQNETGLKKKNSFSKGNIFRFLRSGATKAANNEVRTHFLKSLGEAFGIKGAVTDSEGKTTFSADFVDKLKKFLGPAFKSEDFGISKNGGAVTFGKPLTSRRIQQIMTKASVYSSGDSFSVELYQKKLNNIMKELGMKSTLETGKSGETSVREQKGVDPEILRMFGNVEHCLDLLKSEEDHPETTILRNDYDYEGEIEMNDGLAPQGEYAREDYNPFRMYDKKQGKYLTMNSISDFRDNILSPRIGGGIIHIECIRATMKDKNNDEYKTVAPIKNYFMNQIRGLVKIAIDSYYKAAVNGKLEDFKHHIKTDGGACFEDKIKKFVEFNNANFEDKSKAVDDKLRIELERIAKTGQSTNLAECVTAEIEYAVQKDDFETWEEYAPKIKSKLVGTYHTIVEPKLDKNGEPIKDSGRFVFQPVMKDGQPEFRALTEQDVDKIGKLIYDDSFNF